MADTSGGAVWRRWESAQDTLAPSPSAGRALSIDVERAREVVGRLEALADSVRAQVESLAMIQVVPPGNDAVSRNAAAQSDRMVLSGRAFLSSWHRDLVAGISALQQQISDTAEVDRRNAARL